MATPDEPNELERALAATMDAQAALGADANLTGDDEA